MRLDEFKPSRVGKASSFGQIVRFGKFIKPGVGIGHTQREFMQVENHCVNFFIAAHIAAEFVRELFKSTVAAVITVIFLEQVLNDFLLEYGKLMVISGAKLRVKVNACEISAQNRLTERMERRNLCTAKQNRLPLKVRLIVAVEFGLKAFHQRGLNS